MKDLLPTKDKIKELQSFPYPKDPRSLCRSLGMTGFYCKLCIHYLLLSEQMRLFPKSSFELTEADKASIKNIIHQLSNIATLAHPQSTVTHY